MTSKNRSDAEGDDLGVLDEAASLDTTSLGVLGMTAQVNVAMPGGADDDDLVEDSVVDGEIPAEVVEGVIEAAQETESEPDEEAEISAPSSEDIEDAEVDEDDVEAAPSSDEPVAEAVAPEPAAAKPVAEPEPVAAVKPKPAANEKPRPTPKAKPAPTPKANPAPEPKAKPAPAPKTNPTPAPKEPQPEIVLASKRLGDQLGQSSRETADLLTADRLLNPSQLTKPEPEGTWSHLLYTVSGRRINIGDGRRARERKALTARIASPLNGGARFVPVLSRKGGVGKTTITALLGMALADAREDRVIAVDANPDRGTLADRIVRTGTGRSVRDLVRIHDEVKGYHDVSAVVARDSTRLDVLASDADPRISEAFSDEDYRNVADVAAHYYSMVLTDTGTGIVHSVMGATLDLADQIVIVSGLSVDEARLASETLTWLESNGYEEQARNAVIVLNQSTAGSPLVRLNELEAHFKTRARSVVRMPYDTQIAGGGAIVFSGLQPETRQAARELAAVLVEGLRAKAA